MENYFCNLCFTQLNEDKKINIKDLPTTANYCSEKCMNLGKLTTLQIFKHTDMNERMFKCSVKAVLVSNNLARPTVIEIVLNKFNIPNLNVLNFELNSKSTRLSEEGDGCIYFNRPINKGFNKHIYNSMNLKTKHEYLIIGVSNFNIVDLNPFYYNLFLFCLFESSILI